jgi:hypothetical protein
MSRFSGISVAHCRSVGPEATNAATGRPTPCGFSRREVTWRRIAQPYGESRLKLQADIGKTQRNRIGHHVLERIVEDAFEGFELGGEGVVENHWIANENMPRS